MPEVDPLLATAPASTKPMPAHGSAPHATVPPTLPPNATVPPRVTPHASIPPPPPVPHAHASRLPPPPPPSSPYAVPAAAAPIALVAPASVEPTKRNHLLAYVGGVLVIGVFIGIAIGRASSSSAPDAPAAATPAP